MKNAMKNVINDGHALPGGDGDIRDLACDRADFSFPGDAAAAE